MHKFWSGLAVQLGKRAGLVSIIGLFVTLIMGFGLTKLEHSAGLGIIIRIYVAHNTHPKPGIR